MNLFETYIKVRLKDEASEGAKNLTQTLGAGLKKAAAVGLAAVGTAAAGMVSITKKAVEEYAEYEQLVGGVETLFKESADTVMAYAKRAYQTAGLSANTYMNTVTSFSASLLQSLGGDTAAAADLANQALTDMSDNANKMGTDISIIQNAYQGFAKQNYTMLDNLKLGYGGTQAEMKRLIREAAALDDSIDASSMSFANIVKAINVVQTELGITGTTSKEAATTISGSVGSAKAAWSNLVAGFADENANMDQLVNEFADSVVVAGQNVVPKIAQVGESVFGVVKNYGTVALNYLKSNGPNFAAGFLESASQSLKDPETIGKATEFVVGVGKAIGLVFDFALKTYNTGRQLVLDLFEVAVASLSDQEVAHMIGYGIGARLRGSWETIRSSAMMGFLEDMRKTAADAAYALFTGDFDAIENYKSSETSWAERNYEGQIAFFGAIKEFISSIGSGFKGDGTNVNINVTTDGSADSDKIAQSVSDALKDMLDRRASIYG